jgi:hypothetical protein
MVLMFYDLGPGYGVVLFLFPGPSLVTSIAL